MATMGDAKLGGDAILEDLKTSMSKLAVETRLMIFKFSLCDAIPGKTPDLVKGLVSYQPYYQEVLKAWYETTMMRVGPGRRQASYCLRGLSHDVLQMIKILKVDHKLHRYTPIKDRCPFAIPEPKDFYPNLSMLEPKILAATNVRQLHLDFTALYGYDPQYPTIVELWLRHFKRLNSITIDPKEIFHRFEISTVSDQDQKSKNAIALFQTISARLKVEGIQTTYTPTAILDGFRIPVKVENLLNLSGHVYRPWRERCQWVRMQMSSFKWTAEQGKFLVWSD